MRFTNTVLVIFTMVFPVWGSVGEATETGEAQTDKIKEILLNTKFNELELNETDSSTGAVARDTHSPQYKIGFKDGYQRAVHDVKQSFGEALAIPTTTSAGGAKEPDHDAVQEWLDKSYSKLVVENNWMEGIQAATVALSIDPDVAVGYINRT